MTQQEKVGYVKSFMRTYGMTQSKLAKLLCITPAAIRHWFHGKNNVPDSKIKLMQALAVSLDVINSINK